MRPVALVTDSTADLSLELRKKHGIYSIPLYVLFNDETYADGVDLTTSELYQLVHEKNMIPRTAAVSPGDFLRFFEPIIEEGYDILYLGIGSSLSATFQSARIAQSEPPPGRVTLVDSKNLSSGIGLLVLKAKDMRDQGMSAEAIKEKLEGLVPRVRSYFAIRTLDYLHKGGRASGTAKLIGGILKIKPIIAVRDGQLEVYRKPAGKMSRAVDIMLDDFFAHEAIDTDYVMVTHSEAERHARYAIDRIRSKRNIESIIESQAGCVISSHCGPGTIGILYLLKEDA
ncbi:MAG: DegV family protein [Acholeplasmataceae bacterium]